MALNRACLSVTIGLLAVYPASAAIVDVVYIGTVSSNTDASGYFGPAGGFNNLVGDTYEASFVFNTALGTTYSSATNNYAYGGSYIGVATPVVSAIVTVNGQSVNITGAYKGVIYGENFGPSMSDMQLHEAETDEDDFTEDYVQTNTGALPASITTPFTYLVGSADTSSGEPALQIDGGYTIVYANITSLSVSAEFRNLRRGR